MNYNFIIDPKTNDKHSIFSKNGRNLLKSYLKEYMTGGVGNKDYTSEQGKSLDNRHENTLVDRREELDRRADRINVTESMRTGRSISTRRRELDDLTARLLRRPRQ